MEAVLISGAQGLNSEGLEGVDSGRRYRHHSVDGRPNPPSTSRGRFSPEGRPTLRGRFNSDLGTGAFEQAAKYLRPDKISVYPLFGGSTKRGGVRVKINVSGMIFETLESTLSRFPDSLLGSPMKREKYYDSKKREFFFDRNRVAFDAILYFYQSRGKLLRPVEIDRKTFCEEIQFFELGEDVIERFKEMEMNVVDQDIGPLPENPIQRKIWQVMELPHSSLPAQIVAIWSVVVILVSIVIFCIETLPQFRESRNDKNSALYGLEIFCVAWFTFEYVVRLLAAPQKLRFLRSFLNIIDLVAILPYYVILGLSVSGGDESGNTSYVAFFRILRLVRVFRIFKLSRHYRGLKILGMTLRASLRELLLLSFFLLMGVIIFSSGVYYAESANFGSIPEAFWWSVVTMTTVGYGDKTPTTAWGKVIGSMCAVAGVLTLALPVPVIVSNFSYFYNLDKEKRAETSDYESVPNTSQERMSESP